MYKSGKPHCLASFLFLTFLWVVAAEVQAQPASRLKDPTAPPRTALGPMVVAKPAARLSLNSILIGPGRKVAVINGEIVGEGDTLAGARIMKISSGSVLVRAAGQASRLTLSVAPDVRQNRHPR